MICETDTRRCDMRKPNRKTPTQEEQQRKALKGIEECLSHLLPGIFRK